MRFTIFLMVLLGLMGFSQVNAKKFLKNRAFESYAKLVCSAIVKNPSFNYEKNFHSKFRNVIPYKKLVLIFSSIYQEFGPCLRAESTITDSNSGEFLTVQQHGKKLKFLISLSLENGAKKIQGLRFTGQERKPISIKNFNELQELAKKKRGNFSILFKEIDGPTIFNYRGRKRHALGSVFKLYLLATAMEEVRLRKFSWDQKFKIQNALKSLPSGEMQDLKAGTGVTLYDFASKMISFSDNTATDHLLNILSKTKVERLMKNNRLNTYLKDNRPFLSTMDMFKTRAFFGPKTAIQYTQSSRNQRLRLIKNVPFKDRKDLVSRLRNWDRPKYIDVIEWFATPYDICRLYAWMDGKSDKKFRKIIGKNTPFIDFKKSKRWKFAGYKGGSEPGVLEMSYLLEDKFGKKYCLYIGQNDSRSPLNQGRFFSLVEGVFNLLEELN